MLSYQPAGCYWIWFENCTFTRWWSGPRRIIEVCICYPTVSRILDMVHGSRLTGVEDTMHQGFTHNHHTSYMLSCHYYFLNELDISTRWWIGPVRSMQVWICYPTAVRVLCNACTMADSWVTNHEPWVVVSHPITSHTCSVIILVFWITIKNNIHEVMKLTKEDHAGLDILDHCLRSIVWSMYHI